MKRVFIFFLLISPLFSNGQENSLKGFFRTVPHANQEEISTELHSFIQVQREKFASSKSDIKFLRSLVWESHKRFLKTYKPYSQFDELFENGQYDCLTGTAFFSLVLESLQFQYSIIETNYHIFMMIETDKGNVLLETTDRIFGLKTHASEIQNCLSQYKENVLTASTSRAKNFYKYQLNLFQQVKSPQLEGLLYFNQAVVAFNNHEWVLCVDKLGKARSNYDNPLEEE